MARRKTYPIDPATVRRARRALGTRTDVETINCALALVADQTDMARALERFLCLPRTAIRPIDGR